MPYVEAVHRRGEAAIEPQRIHSQPAACERILRRVLVERPDGGRAEGRRPAALAVPGRMERGQRPEHFLAFALGDLVKSDCELPLNRAETTTDVRPMGCSERAEKRMSCSVMAAGIIGSRSPLEMITRAPPRSAGGGSAYGIMAASSTAPASTSGRRSSMAEAMLAPLENPTATSDPSSIPYAAAGRDHEVGELVGPLTKVILVEDALAEPAEEARHAVLQHGPAHRQHGGTRGQLVPQRQQVVLVAAGAVQQEQRRTGRLAVRGQEDVRPVELGDRSRNVDVELAAAAGRRRSARGRAPATGGSFRCRPSSSNGSSTSKPGASVAISNSTPPGSRK